MNKTKEAVKGFVARSGHHETEVHESIKPAVVHENVKKTHQEEVNTAVDREIHHDHYHNTVQPVQDRQVLPEEHHHQVAGVEHREFDKRNHDATKQALASQQAKFKDERVVEPTVHTKTTAPVVEGEHHHHHIHETVQPVIQRETVQPTVVHTTVPIHETHHEQAQHHAATTLPAISMNEFKSKGGTFGHDIKPHEHHYHYDGEPTTDGKIETGTRGGVVGAGHGADQRHHNSSSTGAAHNTIAGVRTGNPGTGAASNLPGTGGSGVGGMSGSASGMSAVPRSEQHKVSSGGDGTYRDAGGNPVKGDAHKKPSLLDKLNPLKDSDGDGKAGFMK
ncbi:uncharacterized protein B0I36DRAFT_245721 [Microdochium trichocladiopsis]|uniref:Allergen n=1 Tax=Microdochium trichocladiopsis TaxID=1682393 RepID=A0A9P8Y6I5_9PEZI|nr:uncharacterized protein B0I36DRAFT_245721 [Microdochium trichocladiopsis]KAH7028987.1 hypothetical protein B0I36DRAFT_245721 [Microdochium trichocladiopsis]